MTSWLHDVRTDVPFGIKTTEAPHYRRVGLQMRENRTDERPPSAKRRAGVIAWDGFAFVSHTGDIYPSGFLPVVADDVRTDDIVDVYRNSDLFRELRDRSQLAGKCGVCEYRHICGGSRSRAYATAGDPLASDPLCTYVSENWDGNTDQPDITGD